MHPAITDVPADLAGRLDRLADELHAAGVLTDPAWRQALYAVPRHLFIPARAWIYRDGKIVGLDRDRDPHHWWDAVYSPTTPIVTQFNDRAGPPAGNGHAEPSSSCPAPKTQFQLLQALDVADGMRVLEIGTGTGWNAALLAHRLGETNVVSVEIDPDLTRQAKGALAAAGHTPKVECADGRLGHPLGAPYDRIIATCSVRMVPYAWVAQARPGGAVLIPLAVPADGGDLLARLTVNDNGTASGRFIGAVAFMPLRQQRPADGQPPPGLADPAPAGTVTSTTGIWPAEVLFLNQHAAFPTRLLLGEGACGWLDGGATVWLADPTSGSWARTRTPRFPTGGTGPTETTVEQYGPRRLWDEIEAAYRWWQQAGEPDRQRFGLTVTPDAHILWLDQPTRPVVRLPTPPAPAFGYEQWLSGQ